MGFLTLIFRTSSNMVLSLILAAATIAYLAINQAEFLQSCLDIAASVKAMLTDTTNTGLPANYNIWLSFLIEERQLVFMFFIVLARLLLALLWYLGARLFGGGRNPEWSR